MLNSSAERTSIQTPFAFSGCTALCSVCGAVFAEAKKGTAMAAAESTAVNNFLIIQSPIK